MDVLALQGYGRLVKTDAIIIKIGEEIKHKFLICMHAMSTTGNKSNKFSSYNDLKVELTYNVKMQPVGLFI